MPRSISTLPVNQVILGDCFEVMPLWPAQSFDAVVTDPPYGLEFMGQKWDKLARPKAGNLGGFADGNKTSFERVRSHLADQQQWHYQWACEALRLLKPGGHLLAFGGTRTYHRMVCGVEDAGFEIRDQLQWLYGQGLPKSRNLQGAWKGWGTGLKPGHESVVMARKPLSEENVELNMLAYGTGAINVDGARIAGPDGRGVWGSSSERCQDGRVFNSSPDGAAYRSKRHPGGRWPANVAIDQEAAAMLDEQTGILVSGKGAISKRAPSENYSGRWAGTGTQELYGDSGGASRFFYCAKATRAERNAGCEALDERPLGWSSGPQNPGSFQSKGTHKAARNHHPTVKPLALMRWLCRLVVPPYGLLLDPFAGSGSTCVAAMAEGFRFVGVEQDREYCEIARRRLAHAAQHLVGS